jgi:hypothetical protein
VELICEEAAVIFSLHTALNWYFVSHVDLCIRLLLLNKIMFGRQVMDGRVWGGGIWKYGELGIMPIQHRSLRFDCFGSN